MAENVVFTDNTSEIQEELFRISDLKTVPNVFINGRHLGGHDATVKVGKL